MNIRLLLVLLLGLCCPVWAAVEAPQQKAGALVQAVEANQPQRAMELMALNPMMSLDAGIRAAVEARNYTMLNHVVRGTGDLSLALQYAEEMQLTAVKKFLMKKAPASDK